MSDIVKPNVVNVEFQELQTAAKELGSISAEMKETMKKMSALIQEVRDYWQDDNGKKFVAKFETEVQSQFEKYYGTIEEYSNFVNGAYQAYLAEFETTGTSVNG